MVPNVTPSINTGSGYVISGFARSLTEAGAEVRLLDPADFVVCRSLAPRANNLRTSVGMRRAVSRLQLKDVDAIVVWGGASWRTVRWLRSKLRNPPLIIHHSNGPEPKYHPQRSFKDIGTASWNSNILRSLQSVDGIFTVSQDDREWVLEKTPVSPQRVVCIHPGVRSEFLEPIKSSPRKLIAGFCGTWLAKKGTERIITDIPLFLRAQPQWSFHIVGADNPELVHGLFPQDVRDRIVITANVGKPYALREIFDSWSMLIMPSLYESFGLVLVEGMARGLPCVASSVGVATELDHDKQILHLSSEDGALARMMTELAMDATRRAKLGLSAKAWAHTLTWRSRSEIFIRNLELWRQI